MGNSFCRTGEEDDECESIVVNGNKIYNKLDEEIRDLELLGTHEKIAIKAFKDNPNAKKATVVFEGKQSTQFRNKFTEFPDTKKVIE